MSEIDGDVIEVGPMKSALETELTVDGPRNGRGDPENAYLDPLPVLTDDPSFEIPPSSFARANRQQLSHIETRAVEIHPAAKTIAALSSSPTIIPESAAAGTPAVDDSDKGSRSFAIPAAGLRHLPRNR